MKNKIKRIAQVLVVAICLVTYAMGYCNVSADQSPIDINSTDLTPVGEVNMTSLETMIGYSDCCLQNFSRYSTTNIYFVSTHVGDNTYLIRCQLSSGTFEPLDYVDLVSFGHGESLEVMSYDSSSSTYTIWIGATANSNGWSTNIARIKYTVNSSLPSGAVVDSSQTKIITGLVDAAKGSTGYTDYRSAVSITSVSDDRICFSTKKKENGEWGWYYMVYDYSDVNSALNTSGNTLTLTSLASYRKSIFWISEDEGNPNGSFQGEEISGVGSGNKMLYIAGGGVGDDCGINQFKYTNGNNFSLECQYIVKNTTAPTGDFIRNAEIEGIKIYTESSSEYMYMMFRKQGTYRFKIYKYQI